MTKGGHHYTLSPMLSLSQRSTGSGAAKRYVGRAALLLLTGAASLISVGTAFAQDASTFEIEVEAGPVWQSRNDVQIPNDASGTRFSLVDLVGKGPWPAGRLYLTWNINSRHSLRGLLAPLSYSGTGSLAEPVDFAGESYQSGSSVEATYKFNSYRISYRYRFMDREKLQLSVGFTAKIRDAKIELTQGSTTSKDTDVGFVPLVNLAADWRLARRWHLSFDFDGLAGGPGRAFDVALKLGYDISDSWGVAGGYRTIEGGADVESVYNFAWFHYAVASGVYRF
ncbi:MAG: hypothetical protein JSW51_11460 [Gemmatimonadota bacterium]|nr:MAG: hypothetical protein JSW51_11460 [Gemmatimonadota bacterium]